MTGFVSEDEKDLVRGELLDGCVPDDDAFGGAEALDVGVEGGEFGGGLHEEHAVRGDVHVAFGDDLLEAVDKFGVRLGEGFVMEEKGFDVGHDEEAGDREGDGAGPEGQPPEAGEFADGPEEEHEQEAADQPGEEKGFGLIEEPAGPVLDRETVSDGKVMAIKG